MNIKPPSPFWLVIIPALPIGITAIMLARDARNLQKENRELRARFAATDERCRTVDLPPPENTFLGVNRTDGVLGRPLGCDYIEQAFVSTFQACNHPHPKGGNRTMVVCSDTGDWIIAVGRDAGMHMPGPNLIANCTERQPPFHYLSRGTGNVILQEKK
jgi:hypothetical protein